MEVIACDPKGRIYLRRDIREKYGQSFVVVPARGELVLMPVPEDALEDFRSLGAPLRGGVVAHLKKHIREEAKRQAGRS
jgi:hypothetical protein